MAPPSRTRSELRDLVRSMAAPVLVIGALLAFFLIATTGRDERPDANAALGVLADPNDVYNPVTAGEPLPEGFRQVLPRDAIVPIYDPTFVPAGESPWDGATLVIGVAIDDEAKAYPVSLLNRREMVVDSLAGIPVLVTW
jgi:hypothetical protein